MNSYKCDKCDWRFDWWRMGDRVKTVKRHELAHLLDQPLELESRKLEMPANELMDYVHERLRNTKFL